jgi:hypothetical protein
MAFSIESKPTIHHGNLQGLRIEIHFDVTIGDNGVSIAFQSIVKIWLGSRQPFLLPSPHGNNRRPTFVRISRRLQRVQ